MSTRSAVCHCCLACGICRALDTQISKHVKDQLCVHKFETVSRWERHEATAAAAVIIHLWVGVFGGGGYLFSLPLFFNGIQFHQKSVVNAFIYARVLLICLLFIQFIVFLYPLSSHVAN